MTTPSLPRLAGNPSGYPSRVQLRRTTFRCRGREGRQETRTKQPGSRQSTHRRAPDSKGLPGSICDRMARRPLPAPAVGGRTSQHPVLSRDRIARRDLRLCCTYAPISTVVDGIGTPRRRVRLREVNRCLTVVLAASEAASALAWIQHSGASESWGDDASPHRASRMSSWSENRAGPGCPRRAQSRIGRCGDRAAFWNRDAVVGHTGRRGARVRTSFGTSRDVVARSR
jgi:hypothetical protein